MAEQPRFCFLFELRGEADPVFVQRHQVPAYPASFIFAFSLPLHTLSRYPAGMPAPERNHVQVVRCKGIGCGRNVPTPVEVRVHIDPSPSLPRLSGAPVLHRLDGSVHGIAVMGGHARVTGASVNDSNDKPPYRHWHTVCAACGKVRLARPSKVSGDISVGWDSSGATGNGRYVE